jgi:Spy/CpxP family protein refolding chaperone
MNGSRGMILAVSASLIVGCAIGLICGVLFARSMFFVPHPPFAGGHGFGRGSRGPAIVMGFLERRLNLSKDQSEKIEKIVSASRADVDSIRAETRQQILQVLTPEQRAQWERMDRRMFHHGGPPPGAGEPGDEPPPPDRP